MTTLRSLLPLAAALLLAAPAGAQDLTVKAAPQTRPLLISNAVVHTVSGDTIDDGYVFMVDGKIAAVGKGVMPRWSKPVDELDAKRKHLYPGMIAADNQLGLQEMASVRASDDFREVGSVTPEVRAAVAVNPDSTLLPVTRANGVLVAGVFPSGGDIPGRVSVMKLDGWTWEDMAAKADAGLVIDWPLVRPFTAPWMERSDSEQNDDIRRALSTIDDAFKSATAYLAARKTEPSLPTDLRWEAMRSVLPPDSASAEAAKSQLPVFIIAQDLDQIVSAVTWSVDRKLKPVIVGGRDAPLCADLLKRHEVPVILSGTHVFPKRNDSPYDDAYTLPARLLKAGVRFCIASADRNANERNLPYNAATAVAYGLDRDAALKSVTLWPAQILGVGDTLGSIEQGKSATLILTDGDPLEITTHVDKAWIDGRPIDLSSKQSKLADKYREKYRQQLKK
jgi:imidazolonepropionase-like amidohydrolase